MDFWRRGAEISLMVSVRNERIREMIQTEDSIIHTTDDKHLMHYATGTSNAR